MGQVQQRMGNSYSFSLGVGIGSSLLFVLATPVTAQIVPDATLPRNSIVTPKGPSWQIDGGTTRGSNLFHSFSELSIPTNTEAFFNNPAAIENIITRVTGGKLSNIDGLIRANGTANLFLLNPHGIIFGPNARLDLGGSFFGTTADRLLFDNGSFYSATEQNPPPLLTINVPVGLQLGANSGAIEVRGTGLSDIVPTDNFGLTVAPGQTLALVGGDVKFTGAIVTAPSGRIEVGSVSRGEVGLVKTPVGFRLNYDLTEELVTLQLSNRSSLFAPAIVNNPNSGINLTGGTIIVEGSQIVSLTEGNANSGNITVRAVDSLELGGTIPTFPFSAWIVNQVAPGATGNSGQIDVSAPQVSINDGARIQSLSFGTGAAGNVNVNASESIGITGFALPPNSDNIDPGAIALQTLLEQNTNSRISSENLAIGGGGNVRVSTGELTLLAGGQIGTLVGSQAIANGGNVNVTANTIIAKNAVPFNSLVPSGIASYAVGPGNGGEIAISTGQLSLSDGARILSLTVGSGAGGAIAANASELIEGRGANPLASEFASGIFSTTLGAGNSGNVLVETELFAFSEGASLRSEVLIQESGNSVPLAVTGNAGDITVLAEAIELTGTNPEGLVNVTQLSSATIGSGSAGDISISTGQLTIKDGAAVISATLTLKAPSGEPIPGSGNGSGGDLRVTASEAIEIIGENPFFDNSPSLLGTQTFSVGNGGELIVNTPRLILADGGAMGAAGSADGNAGRMIVNAEEISVSGIGINNFHSVIGANAFTLPELFRENFFIPQTPTGNTGEITINTDRLTVTDEGIITVEHQGTGNAGVLQINAGQMLLDSGGSLNATTISGRGGNVELNVRDSLQLRNGSFINVESLAEIEGDGGNLTINAGTIVALENSDIIANAVGGNGGNINITTPGLFRSPDSDITASSRFGLSGTVTINNPEVNHTAILVELPERIDASQQIVEACPADQGNTFTVTGRGGLPPNPTQLLRGRALWQEDRTLFAASHKHEPSLVEATNWVKHSNGQIELVAETQHQRDLLNAAKNLSDLSLNYLKVGELFKAARAAEQGQQLLQQVSHSPETLMIQGSLLNTQGHIQLALGKTKLALETWNKAAESYQLVRDNVGLLGTGINQAQALQSLGFYRQADQLLTSVNHQLETTAAPLMKATALRSWGMTLQALGELDKSTEILQESLAISQQIGAEKAVSAALLGLGNIAKTRQSPQGAIHFYKQAAERGTTPLEKAEALLNLLAVYIEEEQANNAKALLPEIEAEIEKIPASRDGVYVRVNLADSRRKLADLAELERATKLLDSAVKQARALSDERGEAIALSQLALLHQERGDLGIAQQLIEQSLLTAESLGAEEIVARSQAQLGKILKQQGKIEEAIAAYSNAVKGFESLGNDLVAISQELQFEFQETVEPTYRELVSLLLRDNPSQAQLQQAIEAIEALQLAELNNFFRDRCLETQPQPIDQIDQKAAVIYPIILPESLEIILLQPNRPLVHHKIEISQTEVDKNLLSIDYSMRITSSIKPSSAAQKFYEWLIAPFEEQLGSSGIETLVFVLDKDMRNLPLAALYDQKQEAYLVEKYALALTPGLQLLKSQSLHPQKLQALTAGISEGVQGFPALSAVEWELEKVSEQISAQRLLNQEFTIENLENKVKKASFPIVHLATHGQFSSNPEETFILAWDEKIQVTEFEQLLKARNPSEQTPIELLILSACQTATGDRRAALGLAGVAVRSGARSTLATLWSVQDRSTAKFVVEFYQQLAKPNITKAEAMRRTQVALMQGPYKHPYYWAPFVLVGNWL